VPYEVSPSSTTAQFNQMFLVPVTTTGPTGSMTFQLRAKVSTSGRTCTYSNLAIAVTSPR
jgi:hypothetical protein